MHPVYVLNAQFELRGRSGKPVVAKAASNNGQVYSATSGKCWTSNGAGNNGAPAEFFTCNGSANQTWTYGNYGTQEMYHNSGDGKCLNNQNGSGSTGNAQVMWNCYSTANEMYGQFAWSGYYLMQVQNAQVGQCITNNGNYANYAPLVTYPCDTGRSNQYFQGSGTNG